jgi:hypothetical protein
MLSMSSTVSARSWPDQTSGAVMAFIVPPAGHARHYPAHRRHSINPARIAGSLPLHRLPAGAVVTSAVPPPGVSIADARLEEVASPPRSRTW